MPSDKTFVNVILPLALAGTFTYRVPDEFLDDIGIGKRVIVQFGSKRYYTAVVADIHSIPQSGFEAKNILAIADEHALVSELQLAFWQWIADYYMCTVGEIMIAALPSSLKLESKTQITLNTREDLEIRLTETEQLVVDFIKARNSVGIKDIEIEGSRRNIIHVVKSLYDKGVVVIEELLKSGYVPKTETYVRLSFGAETEGFLAETLEHLKKAKKQHELLSVFIRLSGISENSQVLKVKKKILLETAESNNAVLKTLINKGIFEIYNISINRLADTVEATKNISELSDTQFVALNKIRQSFEKFDSVLLYGVTASGKTEVYLHLIHEVLAQNKQVLYLLPEIALTAQIINRLKKHFGNRVGVYHSKFSDNERVEIWNRLSGRGDDRYDIIIGVRSSIFLPFKNLGLIIVDEEHENSFKQYDPAPRYNARDAAIVLAKMHGAKVLLGTATPSVESYFNALNNRYGLVTLTERYSGVQLPLTKIVNMRSVRKKGNYNSHFSNLLLDEVTLNLERGKQVILFQNRRGFSPYIECTQCGWIARCKHCDVTLTYHKYQNHLICHYCGYAVAVPNTCIQCKSSALKTMGFGTEKIEEELSIMFPLAKIARMDLDSTRNKNAHVDLIARFEQKQIDILVGTQMVTKGLDVANVGLVGVLNADNMLNFPDFRAFERSFQLMVQVSGRAGRTVERGTVLIQTSQPEHPIIQYIIHNNYTGMYNDQIEERTHFRYPPVFRIIHFIVKHKVEQKSLEAATRIVQLLSPIKGIEVLGPDKPLIARIQNLYIRNLIVKMRRDAPIAVLKKEILGHISMVRSEIKSLQVLVDVDPM